MYTYFEFILSYLARYNLINGTYIYCCFFYDQLCLKKSSFSAALFHKVEELHHRWTELQNRILSASAQRHSQEQSEQAEQLLAWLRSKLEELGGLEVGSSLQEIRKQLEEHVSFR